MQAVTCGVKVAADSRTPSMSMPDGPDAQAVAESWVADPLCTWAGSRIAVDDGVGLAVDHTISRGSSHLWSREKIEQGADDDPVVVLECPPELVNVAFVPSPTPLLPDVAFVPPEEAPPADRGNILRRWPARWLLLALVSVISIPLLWIPLVACVLRSEPVVAPSANAASLELVLESGELVIRGAVPDQQTADQFESRLADLLDVDRVASELVIDSSVELSADAPTHLHLDETVRFDFGRSTIIGRYQPLVAVAADLLMASDETRLEVVGHTDDVGEADENLRLSERRAEAVRSSIVDLLDVDRVAADRISVVAAGETQPTADNSTEDGRAANRRVEFFIFGLLG